MKGKKLKTNEKKNLHLEAALRYIERGWSIIPIKARSKLPLVTSWKVYQDIRCTKEEAQEWWGKNPEAGIALVCGEISGVIVVDIDKKEGVKSEGHGLALAPTLCARSGGGGEHYFYKWRQGLVGAKVGFRTAVDIRSDASYIIISPSIHPSGKPYEWTMGEDEPIAAAPKWLETSSAEDKSDEPKTDWDSFFKENKGKGVRNMSAAQIAGKILFETSPEMWDTLGLSYFKIWNKDHNVPPLPESELMTVWNSIKKTHLKNNKAPEPEEDVDMNDAFEGKLAKSIEDAVDHEAEEKAIIKMFVKDKTKGTFYLAKYIVRQYSIITVGEKEREMFVYRDGMYFRAENEIIFPEVQRILGDKVTKLAKNETFHKIADMTSYSRDIFQSAPVNLIPLKNGVYNLDDATLSPHSPEHRFTYQFPVVFDPKAECPKIDAFMRQVLNETQLATVQEWMGYYYYRLYMFKKAIIFVGEGDTGKTTLLETIMHLVGKENVSSVSLQKMSSDKFAAAHLYEKHANIVDELSAKDISDTGNFKIATGGGSISGEYKFGNQFSFNNFSKFTFACNKIPDVKDFDDEAYFNRWMVIRFENPIAKRIPNFIKTLTTEEERSGLFLVAMQGLKRLLAQEGFTYGKSAMDTKLEMMRSGSSIAQFASERVAQDVGKEISKEDMYEAYTTFCAENGLAAETIKMFGTKFPFYVSYAADGLITEIAGYGKIKRTRGWRNVSIVKSEQQSLEDSAPASAVSSQMKSDSELESFAADMNGEAAKQK